MHTRPSKSALCQPHAGTTFPLSAGRSLNVASKFLQETEEALPGCIAAELWQLASAAIPPMEMNDSGKQAMNAGKRSSAAQPYQWSYSKWSACSAPCGDGVQQREAQCVDSATGYVVADEQCYLRQVS